MLLQFCACIKQVPAVTTTIAAAAAAVRLHHIDAGRHGGSAGRGMRLSSVAAHRLLVVRDLVGVSLDVRLHLLLVLERLVADRALVALGTVVLHPVQFQHVVVAKVPEANVTVVRLLAGVRPRVHLQLLRTGESFAATINWAFVRFLAC